MGWEYSIGWMVTLPFEITAAGITIEFWKSREEVNPGVWCAVFMSLLIIIQVFGVRGYGEGEFTLPLKSSYDAAPIPMPPRSET